MKLPFYRLKLRFRKSDSGNFPRFIMCIYFDKFEGVKDVDEAHACELLFLTTWSACFKIL